MLPRHVVADESWREFPVGFFTVFYIYKLTERVDYIEL